MDKSPRDRLLKRAVSHTSLKDVFTSKRTQTILASIGKLSDIKKQPSSLANFRLGNVGFQSSRKHYKEAPKAMSPRSPFTPRTLEKHTLPPQKIAKLKRLLSELYLQKVQDSLESQSHVGFSLTPTKLLLPIRDLASKLGQSHKNSDHPHYNQKTKIRPRGFGYIVGQRKDIQVKSKGLRKRFIQVRLPKKPSLDVCVSTEINRVQSPISFATPQPDSYDLPSRLNSECPSKVGFRGHERTMKGIFQNSLIKRCEESLSSSFC